MSVEGSKVCTAIYRTRKNVLTVNSVLLTSLVTLVRKVTDMPSVHEPIPAMPYCEYNIINWGCIVNIMSIKLCNSKSYISNSVKRTRLVSITLFAVNTFLIYIKNV